MNIELRNKLKKVDIVTRRLGYIMSSYAGTIYLSETDNLNDNGVESYIRLYLHKKAIFDDKYTVFFTAEPCKLPGGYSYMDTGLANQVCNYWKKLLKIADELNSLNIVGTRKEIVECVEDIERKRRTD